MATFNWSPNPNFTTNAYASSIGIDSQDGSANSPYRTLQKCKDASKLNIQISGVFREAISFTSANLFGELGAVIDRFNAIVPFNSFYSAGSISNIKFINQINSYLFPGRGVGNNCLFIDCILHPPDLNAASAFIRSIIVRCTNYTPTIGGNNNTIYKSTVRLPQAGSVAPLSAKYDIYDTCDIYVLSALPVDNYVYGCIFNNCRWKFGSDPIKTQALIEVETGLTGILAIRKAMYNKFGGSMDSFVNCVVVDPMFNNINSLDFTLQPLSTARHMAYDGTFIGAKDVGFPTYAYANDLGYPNAFYNASKHANVLVANNSITLARNADGSAVGSGFITEKPKKLGQIYELKGNQSSYIGADRNREMLDVSSDIDMSAPISAGTALTSGVIYINEGGSVVYNSVTYPNRSRITAVDSVQSFTTTEGAVLYAVTEYPNRYTNLIRHKQTITGTQIAAGTDVLTADSWYRVYNNSITWDGKTVPAGDSFQAVAGKLSFTGLGVCVEEFSSPDVWSECIIDAPIKCRRVGNVASGAIDTGTDGKPLTNGHKEYYNATNKVRAEFSIFAEYVQKHWVLNAKMSK